MKARINRFLLGVPLMLSLLVTSCNNFGEESGNEEKNTVSVPTIVVSVVDEKARTAFPEMDTSKITEYHLTGTTSTSGAAIASIDKTWEKDETNSAYSKMTSDSLAISAGDWNFKLTGKVKDSSVELATYEGTLTKTIGSGENSLQFVLLLQEVNVGADAGTGTLEIAIELKDAASTQVKAITGTLLKSSDRSSAGFPIASYNVTSSTPTYTYSVSSVPAGVYIAQIDFYGDTSKEALLGTWLEAVNINSLGAKASISISDVDSIYSITYMVGVLGESSILESSAFTTNTNPTQFTRRNEVSLNDPTMTDYKFIKWVDISSNFDISSNSTSVTGDAFITTSAITGIQKKTVGNKIFCAVFIKDADAAEITDVAITGLDGDGKAKVGSTITATAKVGESNYAGAVSKWIWYYVDDSGETAIRTDSANSTYTVEPKYYGKKIKARVVPKYDARNLSSGSVVLNNSTSDYVYKDSEEKEISKGTLNAGDVVLKYTETPVRGTELGNHFAIKEGTLKDSTVGTWTLPNGENYQVTVTYNDSKNAPDVSSGEVSGISVKFDVKVKDVDGNFVEAYETLSTTKNVFVNVQYEANTSNLAALPALDKENDYAITYRKLKFTSASTSLTSKEQSATMQYRIGTSGTWKDISASEFDGFTAGQDIVIQLRYKATGTADTAGYIKESDAFDFETISWSTASDKETTKSGLGKKIVLDKVEISGDAKVCGTLTATAKPTFTNGDGIDFTAEGYGTITWNWKAGSDVLKTEADTHNKTSSLKINEALRTRCFGKTLTAEAVYTYSKVDPAATITKSATSSSIGAGGVSNSSGISLTYAEKELSGADLSESKLSVTGSFVNALNETVDIEGKSPTFNFDGAKAPSSSGDVNVKVTVNGYDTMTVPVKIDVKAAAPSIGGGGEGGGGSGSSAANTLLKEDVGYIPYGHIKFDDTFRDMSINGGNGPSLAFYEYTADGDGAEHWYPIIPQNDKPDSLGAYVKNKGDGRLFAPDSGNGGSEQTIRIRYRKRAFKTGGSGIGDYAFYDVNKKLWVSHVGEKIGDGDGYTTDDDLLESGLGYSGITEASDSIPVDLTDHVGKYSGKITDITVNNDSELKLTVSGKTVTASREAGLTGFTYQWYLDDEIVSDATAIKFTLPDTDTYRLHDKYVIRLEAKDGDGQIYTATATVTVGN